MNGIMKRIRTIVSKYIPGAKIYTDLPVSDSEADRDYVFSLF
jgi:hypothetical protein